MFKFCCFVLCIHVVFGIHLPDYINTCRSSSSDFETCLNAAVEDAIGKMAVKGIPEVGVPPIDPFVTNSLDIERTPGAISLQQNYTNIRFFGLSKLKLNSMKVHIKKSNCYIDGDMVFPSFEVKAHYLLKGQMLIFPIDSEGDLSAKYKNARIVNKMSCEKFKKDGEEYIRIISSKINFTFDDLKFDMGRIIPGNDQLDNDIHHVIDEDPRAFFEIIRPSALNMMQNLYIELSNKLFLKVPVNEIFKK